MGGGQDSPGASDRISCFGKIRRPCRPAGAPPIGPKFPGRTPDTFFHRPPPSRSGMKTGTDTHFMSANYTGPGKHLLTEPPLSGKASARHPDQPAREPLAVESFRSTTNFTTRLVKLPAHWLRLQFGAPKTPGGFSRGEPKKTQIGTAGRQADHFQTSRFSFESAASFLTSSLIFCASPLLAMSVESSASTMMLSLTPTSVIGARFRVRAS